MKLLSWITTALVCCSTVPALAADAVLQKAFTEVEKHAREQKKFTATNKKAEDAQEREGIKQIDSVVGSLSPHQLLELIKFSHSHMQGEPFKHGEPYLNYHEAVVHFSIRRLGEMTSPEAVKALNADVPKIVGIDGSMGLVYDNAKEHQAKLLSSTKNK